MGLFFGEQLNLAAISPHLTPPSNSQYEWEHSSYVERESFGITVLAKQNQPKDSQNEV